MPDSKTVSKNASKLISVDKTNILAALDHLREDVPGLENGLIQIWTERCPNEPIWKQICYSFGKVYLGSKIA